MIVILWCLHKLHVQFQPIFHVTRPKLYWIRVPSVTVGCLYATARSMVQHTDHSHTFCSSILFFCFVSSFGTHNNVALSLWLVSVENVLLQVSSFESPNCWDDPLAYHRFWYPLCMKKDKAIPNQMLRKFWMGHISPTRLVKNVWIQNC
jgi:hypothetical protein